MEGVSQYRLHKEVSLIKLNLMFCFDVPDNHSTRNLTTHVPVTSVAPYLYNMIQKP